MNNNKMMTAVSLIALSVALIAIGSVIQTQNSIDRTIDNNHTLVVMAKNHENLTMKVIDQKQLINELEVRLLVAESEVETKLTSEDVANFEARLLIQENAIRTLSANKIDVQTHESTATDFNLVLLNNKSLVQDIYELNEIVYITGDAGSTVKTTISMKIRDNAGNILLEKGFGIANEGRFSSIYMVPDLESGIYTITITDGTIVDSITFEVQ